MNIEKAERLKQKLVKRLPHLEKLLSIRYIDNKKQGRALYLIAEKSVTLTSQELVYIGLATDELTLNFGRSGPNFRLIIS